MVRFALRPESQGSSAAAAAAEAAEASNPPAPRARQRALQQARELGVAEGDVRRLALRQLVDHGAQREQALVDEGALQPVAAVDLRARALAARQVDQVEEGQRAAEARVGVRQAVRTVAGLQRQADDGVRAARALVKGGGARLAVLVAHGNHLRSVGGAAGGACVSAQAPRQQQGQPQGSTGRKPCCSPPHP